MFGTALPESTAFRFIALRIFFLTWMCTRNHEHISYEIFFSEFLLARCFADSSTCVLMHNSDCVIRTYPRPGVSFNADLQFACVEFTCGHSKISMISTTKDSTLPVLG